MYSFYDLYHRYKTIFVYKKGQAKFDKMEEKIRTSTKLIHLNELSFQRRLAPTRTDFSIRINEIPYFILAGAETIAMAEFIAIKNWNEQVNSVLNICSDYDLFRQGASTINHWMIKL